MLGSLLERIFCNGKPNASRVIGWTGLLNVHGFRQAVFASCELDNAKGGVSKQDGRGDVHSVEYSLVGHLRKGAQKPFTIADTARAEGCCVQAL